MSAQVVSGPVNLNCGFVQSVPGTIAVVPYQIPLNAAFQTSLNNGTATAGDIDCIYSKPLTLAAGVTTVNLHSFTDPAGNTVAMARCRFWFLYNTTVTAGYIINVYTLTGTNPLTWLPIVTTGTLWCPPGGMIMGVDPSSTTTNGWVVGSAANTFTVDPGANTCTCQLVIAGNTAA